MIKIILLSLLLSAAMAAQQKPAPKKAAPKASPKPAAKAAPAPLKIPAGATQIEPGTWAHTDAQGKRWLYRETPFGIARMEDKPAPPAAERKAEEGDATTAVEDGDVIHFTRPGPFGVYKWSKKKSELNEQEKSAWNRQRDSEGKGRDAKAEQQ
jgi:hypothetical protein